jgi:hypothetical protein
MQRQADDDAADAMFAREETKTAEIIAAIGAGKGDKRT